MQSKMSINTLRIGTRESKLALWQAQQVKDSLETKDFSPQLIPI